MNLFTSKLTTIFTAMWIGTYTFSYTYKFCGFVRVVWRIFLPNYTASHPTIPEEYCRSPWALQISYTSTLKQPVFLPMY